MNVHGFAFLLAALAWTFRAGASVLAPPVAVGPNTVIADTHGDVIALNARTGKVRWSTVLENGIYAAPLVYKNTVVVSTGTPLLSAVQPPDYAISATARHSDIVALDASTGDIVWEYDLAGSGAAACAIDGDTLLHHDGSSEVLALGAADGRYRWRRFVASAAASNAAVRLSGGRFATSGAFPNAVTILRVRDGKMLHRVLFPQFAFGFAQAPIVTDGTMVYGTYFLPQNVAVQHVYAVDASTGRIRWDVAENRGTGSATLPQLALDGGILFAGSPFKPVVQAIDAKSGALLWEGALHGRSAGRPLVRGRRVYAADSGGWIDAFDVTSGSAVGAYDAGEDLGESTAAAAGTSLAIGSESGLIRSIPFADI